MKSICVFKADKVQFLNGQGAGAVAKERLYIPLAGFKKWKDKTELYTLFAGDYE